MTGCVGGWVVFAETKDQQGLINEYSLLHKSVITSITEVGRSLLKISKVDIDQPG